MTKRLSLRTAREFSRVYRSGRRARVDGVTVWAAPALGPAPTRLGLAVPAGTGRAVTRNRLRRRLREIVRAYAPGDGLDVVIRADREAAGRNFQELDEVVVAALEQVGVRTTP